MTYNIYIELISRQCLRRYYGFVGGDRLKAMLHYWSVRKGPMKPLTANDRKLSSKKETQQGSNQKKCRFETVY